MELARTNRNISIDVLRILACALVVLHHTKIDSSNSILHLLYAASFTITRCAVPLFFMISGYLLISQSGDAMSFLKKRFDRIIVPLLVWLLVYNLFSGTFYGVTDWTSFFSSFFSLESAPHLWFLYALIGVYLLIPIVSPFLQKVTFRGLVFYMLIWGITLIFNNNNFTSFPSLDFNHHGMVFTNIFFAILPFYGYFGYLILGYIVKIKWEYISRSRWKILSAVLLIGIVSKLIILLLLNEAASIAYLSIPTVAFALFLFIGGLCLKFPRGGGFCPAITVISDLTFGIYLVHLLVYDWLTEYELFVESRIFTFVVTFLLSALFTYLLSKLPFRKYIIG